jgi:hypothetical protein
MSTNTIEEPKKMLKKKVAVNSHFKQKEYRVRIYANDDVYETNIQADRISLIEQSIVFYSKHESIIAIYPSCKTEVMKVSEI